MSSLSPANRVRRNRAQFPPGPPNRLFGMLFGALQQNPLEYFTELTRQYGDVWGMRIGRFRSLFINRPDLIEEVLVNKARLYHKGRILQANKYLFGEGLLTAEGDFWLRQRRLAQPALHRADAGGLAERRRARHPPGDDESGAAHRRQDVV